MKPVVRIVSNGEKFKLQECSGFWPFHLWLDLGTGLSFSALRPFRVSYYRAVQFKGSGFYATDYKMSQAHSRQNPRTPNESDAM